MEPAQVPSIASYFPYRLAIAQEILFKTRGSTREESRAFHFRMSLRIEASDADHQAIPARRDCRHCHRVWPDSSGYLARHYCDREYPWRHVENQVHGDQYLPEIAP